MGGAEHLHSHATVDGFWMVITGRVRFYGDAGRVLGEFGPMEGIMLPRGNRYGFESISDGDSEVLQVLGIDARKGFQRDDHQRPRYDQSSGLKWFDARTRSAST